MASLFRLSQNLAVLRPLGSLYGGLGVGVGGGGGGIIVSQGCHHGGPINPSALLSGCTAGRFPVWLFRFLGFMSAMQT